MLHSWAGGVTQTTFLRILCCLEGWTCDIKPLSRRCKCEPNVLFKAVAGYRARDASAPGFMNSFITALAYRLPLPLFYNTNICRSRPLQFFLFPSVTLELEHLLSDKLSFLPSNSRRVTEECSAELWLCPQPQSLPAGLYFLWALAIRANHFHGWFKKHVPNLELLTPGREQAAWQMPWALTASMDVRPRPSSRQVVLRFVSLLASARLGLDQVISVSWSSARCEILIKGILFLQAWYQALQKGFI